MPATQKAGPHETSIAWQCLGRSSISLWWPPAFKGENPLGTEANFVTAREIALVLVRFDHVANRIVTGIKGLKKRVWADLFVTLGFGSLSQVAMSSALRVITL